ncbi:MAG: hypothetical protein GKR89_06110 [Candidatus Latescibacteria bacterium]|nr:hypothetical protein [Candidatus Latescibacterota bacterium]
MAEYSLGQAYRTEVGAYDEMQADNGVVRPHWQDFIQALDQHQADELRHRRQDIRRLLREDGASYNVHADTPHTNRPWDLDPIPLLISQSEWETIEAGLIQRAELLNLILKDLYGPRTLLRQGLVPEQLFFAQNGFLLPCTQTLPPGHRPLVLYAADLARAPDGSMRVLSDRTQVPYGAGYALENRTVLRRAMPGPFRQAATTVRRLVFFFLALRTQLAALAPQPKSDVRIVVLTPGPQDQTYFEHAYLAAYLGYPLVQGNDLTVRDSRVWLKSLEGLQAVDVILRRVDDFLCDPLELDGSSSLGVPGLLEAARQGNVALANPLGSGALENPGLMPFLPALCRHLLGQDLKLPSIATWWCGQPQACQYVLDHLDRLIVKSIHRQAGKQTVEGDKLNRDQLATWRARIQAQPHLYVAQDQLNFSTAPSLAEDRLEPRHTLLRSFLVAQEESYMAMPGGLTRSALDKGSFLVAPGTEVTKDTWVLTSQPEQPISLWLQRDPTQLEPVSGDILPSHTAENLFWVGRYAERAESSAVLLRTVIKQLSEQEKQSDEADTQALHTLLRALTVSTNSRPGFVGQGSKKRLADPYPELQAIALDQQRQGSLSATLHMLVRAAYSVRERWSMDSWRVIDDLQENWGALTAGPHTPLEQIRNHLDQLVTDLMAFTGLNMESMNRELGWVLLDIGRRIERAVSLIALLRSTLVPRHEAVVESLLMEAALTTQESLITYRRRYRAHLHLQTVLDLLLFDDRNPRSLIYQLERLNRHIGQLPRQRQSNRLSPEEQLILGATTHLRLADPENLLETHATRHRALDRLLAKQKKQLSQLSEIMSLTFFSHSQVPRQLGGIEPESQS